MANDDWVGARGGLLPVDYPMGNYKKTLYRLTTGAAALNIFLGMPVDLDSSGNATPQVEWSASNNLCLGSIVGYTTSLYDVLPSALLSTSAGPVIPGNTDAFVLVCDDPMQDFVIQENTGGTALTLSEVGNNCNPGFRSTSGNTTTGYAAMEIVRASAGTGTGGILMIKGLHRYMNSDGTNNAVGNYGKWIVRIVRHRWLPMSGGPTGTQV